MQYERMTREQLIVECRETAASLRKVEEEFNILVHNIPAMVFKGYDDWSVDFRSNKVEEITGYPKADFDSKQLKWSQLILEEDLDNSKAIFINALKMSRSYVREYRIRRKDGEIIWIEERSHIVCDLNDRIEYVSGLFFDITDRVLTEKSAAKYRESLQEMLMARTKELREARKLLEKANIKQGELKLGELKSEEPEPKSPNTT